MDPATSFSFVAEPLDRSDALRDDAIALGRLWPDARVILIDNQGHCVGSEEGGLYAPAGRELGGGPGLATFLGMRGQQAWFALPVELSAGQPTQRVDLRAAAAHWSPFESTLFAQARAMLHWRVRQRFCGVCGQPVAFKRGGWQAHCGGCGTEHYPRTDPAIIAAVTDGERLLLGRQAGWPERRYSTLAGFVEPGESLEQTVAREVLEESGVRVCQAHYLGSQPWAFPGSLMLGFVALAKPDPPQVGDELEDARWFDRDEVGRALRGDNGDLGLLLSPRISISRWLIETWFARIDAGSDVLTG